MKNLIAITSIILTCFNLQAETDLNITSHTLLSELKIFPDDSNSHQQFGHAVSVSGNYLATSSTNDDDNGIMSGAVYMYENDASGWQQKQKISGNDIDENDLFGHSVSVNGNRIAIGAIGVNTSGLDDSGAVYIFERINQSWVQSHKLIANIPEVNARFGTAVSMFGDNLVIGSPGVDSDTGSAFVFAYDNSTQIWSQIDELTDNNSIQGDNFGFSVSLYEQSVLVGVDTGRFNNSEGYATLFLNLTNNQQTTFSANDANGANGFGYSVGLYENKAIIGSIYDNGVIGSTRSGSAYLFEYDAKDLLWNQSEKFSATGTTGTDNTNFGNAVSVQGNRVIIGAYKARPLSSSGSSFLFEFEDNNWVRSELSPSDGGSSDQFGFSVALTDNWIVVGSNLDDNGVQISDAGSIYLFFEDIIFSNSFE